MSKSRLDRMDMINEWIGRVAAFLILVIIAVTLFEVVMRYVFDAPTVWAMETSGLLQMNYVMLGGGYTLLHKGHVRVDVVYARFSPRGQAIADLTITTVLFFCFTGALLYYGTMYVALKSFMIKELSSSGIWYGQIWPFKQIIPIGTVLIMLQFVLLMIRDFRVLFATRPAKKRVSGEVAGF